MTLPPTATDLDDRHWLGRGPAELQSKLAARRQLLAGEPGGRMGSEPQILGLSRGQVKKRPEAGTIVPLR